MKEITYALKKLKLKIMMIMAKFLYKFNLNFWPNLTYNIREAREKSH
jgi:hypothetical protein